MELRTYQEESKSAVLTEWENGNKKTLLVLPTGCGKTIVFSKIIEERVRDGGRGLVLAHRGELLEQAADKLYQSTGLKCATEKASETCLDSWYRVAVGSVQSLQRPQRLAKFPKDFFDFIVIDEAHHAISDGYQRVLEHFDEADVLGVTATPDRGDMKNLGSYFESLAYEYTLPKAIKEGYLSPIKAITIPLKIDLSSVGQQAGDFKASEVGTALDPYLEGIAEEMKKQCADRKTVVFLPLIATSQKFCKLLNEMGFNAVEVNGNSEDRAEILEDFDKGKYNILCNSMLLTEGWDCPSVDCVVVLRPTKVRSLYSQMVGRGTRLYPGKEELLLLDFLWHTERHELCHPAHLICENEEVAKKVTQNLENAPGVPMDLEMLEEKAKSDVVEEREAALAAQLAEMKKRKRKLVDPLQFEMSIQAEDLSSYVPSFGWEMSPPSEKQVKALEKMGIFADEIDNAGKANLLLDRLQKRRVEGLASPKQIRFLEGRGFQHVGSWNGESARKLIDRIAGNNWRIPSDINPREYEPKN
ncbi:DEAD/DEAH box helicase [Erysipelotrichaceae bacterium MTC7]|nr:DEAD/DEAH box helicase [Erysipelotrichaceae bacterium MTC7]